IASSRVCWELLCAVPSWRRFRPGGFQTMSSAPTLNRLLVPLDGSEFAEQAIPYAAAIAGSSGRLILLRVLPGAEPARDLLGTMAVAENETRDPAAHEARTALEATAAKWSVILTSTPGLEVASGDPASQISRTAERLECDLIVSASHGRGAVKRLAFGSVADS